MAARKGFTLVEMMMVVLIVGILTTIALPRYILVVEKGRSSEARQALGAIREAELAYYIEYDQFASTTGPLALPYPASCTGGYYFNYSIDVNGAVFTATATRCTSGGKNPQGTAAYFLSLTQAGVLNGTAGVL